jgi:hypothetical protein
MTDPVIVWNLICFAVFGISVLVRELPPHEEQRHRSLEVWLIDAKSHEIGIEGYQDPLFSDTESQPMELTQHVHATQKQ